MDLTELDPTELDPTEGRPSHLHRVEPSDPSEQPTRASTDAVAPTVEIHPWWDPGLAVDGFSLRSDYVERFWLGVIGPSVTLLLRRLARGMDEHPGGFSIDVADTARAIGLSTSLARNAPMPRTLERACMFSTMRRSGDRSFDVRTHLPRLTRRQLSRLPTAVRVTHDAWLAEHDRSTLPPPAA